MVRINHAIVHGGQVLIEHLPFPDGARVVVTVDEVAQSSPASLNIHQLRSLLARSVERFDEPLEPMIPPDEWETLK